MRAFSFGRGGWGHFNSNLRPSRVVGKNHGSKPRSTQSSASSNAAASTQGAGGILNNPVFKSGLISGSLSLLGDLVAQLLSNVTAAPGSTPSYDAARAARMGTFGLFFYGPYQHYWYRALDRTFPARNLVNFVAKVGLNQACLAPLVITAAFAWTLALQGKFDEYEGKLRRDFKPTLLTGWTFWVPAASINFAAIPLQSQVLYMSTCGVVWTAFLSYYSSKQQKAMRPCCSKK